MTSFVALKVSIPAIGGNKTKKFSLDKKIREVIEELYHQLPPQSQDPLLRLFPEEGSKMFRPDEALCNFGLQHMETVQLRRENRYQFSLVPSSSANTPPPEQETSSTEPNLSDSGPSTQPSSISPEDSENPNPPNKSYRRSTNSLTGAWISAKSSTKSKSPAKSLGLGLRRAPTPENQPSTTSYKFLEENEFAPESLFLDYGISTADAAGQLIEWAVGKDAKKWILCKVTKQQGKTIYKQELGELKNLKQYKLKQGDLLEVSSLDDRQMEPVEIFVEYSPLIVEEMKWNDTPITTQTTPMDLQPTSKEKKGGLFGLGKKDKPADVSMPFNVQRKAHVNFDFKWSGQKPEDIFEIKEELGRGAFGAVVRGTHKETKFDVAIKRIPCTKTGISVIQKEIDVLKSCKYPHILSYFGTCTKEDEVWILMDYCAVGSVKDLMVKTLEPLDEDQIARVAQETLKGLAYLHGRKILHLDIKAGNLMLTEEGVVKLGDFGVSEAFTSATAVKKDLVGSPLYMAPEIILKEGHDEKSDIWSFGITLIELAEGRPPNNDIKNIEGLIKIVERDPPTLKNPKAYSKTFSDIIAKCLVKDPKARPTAIDLLQHPFVQNVKGPEIMKPIIRSYLKLVRPQTLSESNNDV